MTIAKFRNIDILIFTLLAVVIDFVLGRYGLFGLRMYFSLILPITLIVFIRWRKWGFVTLGIVALAHIFIYWENQTLIILSHILSLLVISVFALLEPRIYKKRKTYAAIVFVYSVVYITMIFVEWIALIVFAQEISIINILVNHSVNFFLGLFILLIMYLQKDLATDMRTYFIEREKEN